MTRVVAVGAAAFAVSGGVVDTVSLGGGGHVEAMGALVVAGPPAALVAVVVLWPTLRRRSL